MALNQEFFDEALAEFHDGNFAEAAAQFWIYIDQGGDSIENREWAQFFLAESFRELDLTHAAVRYYYTVAKTRSQPEILPDALRNLEEISSTLPFSETLVHRDLIYDSEFGTLPDEIAQWVHYIQGLYNFRNDFVRWGRTHFKQISEESLYGLKAMYVEAVHSLRRNEDDRALAILDTIISSPQEAPGVKNKAFLAQARLLFDKGLYEDALKSYEKVEQIDLSFEQAQLLVEKAWAYFHMKEYRKAMGLLHALGAPSYVDFLLPDAYLLRGLIFKELCHFIPAKRAVREFFFDYGRPLEDLRRREPLRGIRRIVDAATQDGPIARRTALLRVLERERKAIEDFDSVWEDSRLDMHLRRLYDLEIREQARIWSDEFKAAAESSARALLDAEEQIQLLDYEIGLDIFKRIKTSRSAIMVDERLVVPFDSDRVYYEFDTEYWNDELHSYQYFIADRCLRPMEAKR